MKNKLIFHLVIYGFLLLIMMACSRPASVQRKTNAAPINESLIKAELSLINDSLKYELVLSSDFTDYFLEIYNYEERVSADTIHTTAPGIEKSIHCKFNLDNARSGAMDVTLNMSPLSEGEEGCQQEISLPLFYKKCLIKHTIATPEELPSEFTSKSGAANEEASPQRHRIRISYLEKR